MSKQHNRSLIDITRDLVLARNEYEIFNEEELMKRVDELYTELHAKEDGIYFFYKNVDQEISLFDAQILKMKNHVATLKKAQERIKINVLSCHQATDTLPSHSVFNPIKVSTSNGAVDVIDDSIIPESYWITTTSKKLDKKRILEELKTGESIPGVRLVQKDYVRGIK